jgi:hypothetical protein
MSSQRRRTMWAGGAIASFSLVLSSFASPALAIGLGDYEGGPDGYGHVATTPSQHGGDGDHRPPPPHGAKAKCNDIDAYRPAASHEVKAVLSDGVTYAGIRDLTPAVTGFTWYDLSDTDPEYPENACSVAISSQDNLVSIEVLTTKGDVWETRCTVVGGNPFDLACDEDWVELNAPAPGDPPDM